MQSRFRLVTFDITNTLLKFRTSVGNQYAEVGKLYGVKADISKLNASFKHQWKLLSSTHPNYGSTTGLSSETWWKEIVKGTLIEGSSSPVNDAQIKAISDHLFKLYGTSACWNISPGALPQLKKLQEANVIMGVISNFDERLNSVLIATGLRPFFKFVLASYVVQKEKPNREIFDLALEQVKHVKIQAADAIHIGDNLHFDYLAAKNAGWSALLLQEKDNSDADVFNQVDKNDILYEIGELEKFLFTSKPH